MKNEVEDLSLTAETMANLIRENKLKELKELYLDKGVTPNLMVKMKNSPKGKVTLLSVAILSGRFDIIKLLLEYNADVNKPDTDLRTPIIKVFIIGNRNNILKIFKLLLKYNPNLTQKDNMGDTFMAYAEERSLENEVEEILKKHKSKLKLGSFGKFLDL